jgi:hypothetical protein
MPKYAVRVVEANWGTREIEAEDAESAEELVRELLIEENGYLFWSRCRSCGADGETEIVSVEEVPS